LGGRPWIQASDFICIVREYEMAGPVQAWPFWHNGPFGTMSLVKFCIAGMLLRERKYSAGFRKL
jgi:hypothetical protein